MRFITESELRESFKGGAPGSYELPRDARLTPAARQYLMDLRLWRAGGGMPGDGVPGGGAAKPARDKGAKPEHMTHLTKTELVCKSSPRIELRGRLDSLAAEILIVQTEAPAEFALPLEDALSLVKSALAADVKGEHMPPWLLGGMNEAQVRAASHRPQEFGYAGHIRPSVTQGRFPALINRLRAITRECELCAVRAYMNNGAPTREDIVLALNRLSSYFYVLQLRAAAGRV